MTEKKGAGQPRKLNRCHERLLLRNVINLPKAKNDVILYCDT